MSENGNKPGYANGFLWILAGLLFFLGLYHSWHNEVASANSNYGFGVLLLFFIFLPEFKFFSAFGLKAQLREKIEEANATIQQLRSLATPIAEFMFIVIGRAGRYGRTFSPEDELRLIKATEQALKGIGTSNTEIEAAKAPWYQVVAFDMTEPIFYTISNVLTPYINKAGMAHTALPQMDSPDYHEAHKRVMEEHAKLLKLGENLKNLWRIRADFQLIPGEIKSFINFCPCFTDEDKSNLQFALKDQLALLEHFIKYRKFKWEVEGLPEKE